MQITLIRHAMTAGNAERRYVGRTDEPLSEAGIALASEAKSDPDVQVVYVTPMQRTQQTAQILFPNARLIPVDGLQEMDFGAFEMKNAEEMVHDYDYRAWVDGDCLDPCPNGESWNEFAIRVCRTFAKTICDVKEQGADEAVFVVHGGTIMAIMEWLRPTEGEQHIYSVKNCSGFVFQFSAGVGMPFIMGEMSPLDLGV